MKRLTCLSALYCTNRRKGLRWVIRDHSHSHFCVGGSIPTRPSLVKLLADRFSVRSIVTERHLVDSYLTPLHNNWVHFEPATVEEYALRYEAFLDHYTDEPIFRYEDFIEHPDETLRRICTELDLPFPEGYRELFMVHTFSGDSGRKGGQISPRPRRSIPEPLKDQINESKGLYKLSERLVYDMSFINT